MPAPRARHAGHRRFNNSKEQKSRFPPLICKVGSEFLGVSHMRLILVILLVLLLVGSFPVWPYSTGWGYYPTGGVSLLVIIVVVILFAR
jgi:hypothetical protein